MDTILYAIIGGLLVGALFGFVLQRGRFCMNSAFRDILLMKEFKLAKAVVIAIVVAMIGFAIAALSGVVNLSVKPLNVKGAIIGGTIFGVGMVLAAGCASGTTYRVGEGMMGSLVAGFGLLRLLNSFLAQPFNKNLLRESAKGVKSKQREFIERFINSIPKLPDVPAGALAAQPAVPLVTEQLEQQIQAPPE